MRTDGERLLLDCHGGALELTEVRPPGARPMPAQAWLRGRPDPALTDFWLDPRLPGRDTDELVRLAVEEWDSGDEWAPYLSALGWRGTPDVLAAIEPLADDRRPARPQRRSVRRRPARRPAAHAAGGVGGAAPADGRREQDPNVLAMIADAFGNLGEPYGHDWLLRMRAHPDAAVREGVVTALAGRTGAQVVEALIELSTDTEPAIRDWATFALGTLAEHDSAELRDALAARLDDADPDARIEAVHGLAVRADTRAVEPALALLDAGERGGSLWSRHALQEAAIRLGALSGDPRFAPHLPALDDGWRGTTLERELQRAIERCASA